MDAALLFRIGNSVALLSWLALAVSLFWPRPRSALWRLTSLGVPALLAIAYGVLVVRGLQEAPEGGFGSLQAVRALFASDATLAAGWLHYLAFDLFVGTHIARVGTRTGVAALLLLPCLALTFLFGPLGYLLFLVLTVLAGRSVEAAS